MAEKKEVSNISNIIGRTPKKTMGEERGVGGYNDFLNIISSKPVPPTAPLEEILGEMTKRNEAVGDLLNTLTEKIDKAILPNEELTKSSNQLAIRSDTIKTVAGTELVSPPVRENILDKSQIDPSIGATKSPKSPNIVEADVISKKTEDITKTGVISKRITDNNKTDLGEKITNVALVRISEDVLDALSGLKNDKPSDDITDPDKIPSSSGTISKLAPLLMLGGGIMGSISKILDGDPLQGIFTIVSKGLTKLFTSIGGSLIKNIKTIVTKMPFINKLTGGIGKKIGGKFGVKVLGKKFLKRIPIIGSLISVGSAISRFKKGEVIQGLVDLGAAVATMFPGVGTGIAVALDLFNASMDVTKAKTGEKSVGGIMGIWKNWYMKKRYELPVISTLSHIGDALGYLMVGDVKGFSSSYLKAGLAIPGVSTVLDWMMGDTTPEEGTVEGSGSENLVSGIQSLYTLIVGRTQELFTRIINKAKNWVIEAVSNIPLIGDKLKDKVSDMFGDEAPTTREDDLSGRVKKYMTAQTYVNDSGEEVTQRDQRNQIYQEMQQAGFKREEIRAKYDEVKKEQTDNMKNFAKESVNALKDGVGDIVGSIQDSLNTMGSIIMNQSTNNTNVEVNNHNSMDVMSQRKYGLMLNGN